jgi:hypothetical protein
MILCVSPSFILFRPQYHLPELRGGQDKASPEASPLQVLLDFQDCFYFHNFPDESNEE